MKPRMTDVFFFQQPLDGGAGPVEQKDGFKQIIRMMVSRKQNDMNDDQLKS